MLTQFGLDDFGERVYRAVLRHPGSDEAALEWLPAPTAMAEAELGNLLERGLVRLSGTGWVPVDPEQILQEAHAHQEAELARQRARMAEERAELYGSGLLGDYLAGRGRAGLSVGLEVLIDTVEVFRQIEAWTQSTHNSLSTFITGAEPPGFGGMYDVLQNAETRGINVNSVWTPDALAGAGGGKPAIGRQLASWGVHRADALSMRCIIWDDQAALIPIDVSDIARGAFLVQTATILTPLITLFRRSWERADPWTADDDALAPREVLRRRRAIIALLARGLTDDVVARQLGVGVRTVKRDVEALYHEVGASSRFQLGAAAKERGWI
jgi:DNA-binding CsgD family transcriptional regulator